MRRDWNAPTHKQGTDSRDAAACQRHKSNYLRKRQPRREREMIKGVIIVNNLGVVRLAKFYEQVHVTGESAEQAQQSVIKRI